MAKVLCINDYKLYSEMVALWLQRQGHHEVQVRIVPFRTEDIRAFDPDVILLSLVRKMEALRSPLADFDTEVDGARALRTVTNDPTLRAYPLILTAIALTERELPAGLDYVAFIEVPSKLDYLLEVIERVAAARGQDLAPE